MGFAELTKKLSPTVKRIAYRLNGHYRSFSHDDLYQEAMLHLWNDFREGKLQDKTDSYILQGCYFYLKNYIRKVNEKFNSLSIEAMPGEGEGKRLEEILSLPAVNDCRNHLNNKFICEDIQNNGFNPREKKILVFLREGLTMRQIGKKTGRSHVSVVKAVSRIRQKAMQYLDRENK
ncbi:MAG: sigma-70 family RNA polymerase sigma factor [Candidatus Omnitrophica bacterium]|nr:sigma-70 family RNA polymerase sigma factor [Candidatus Omnitrophota bacterium]